VGQSQGRGAAAVARKTRNQSGPRRHTFLFFGSSAFWYPPRLISACLPAQQPRHHRTGHSSIESSTDRLPERLGFAVCCRFLSASLHVACFALAAAASHRPAQQPDRLHRPANRSPACRSPDRDRPLFDAPGSSETLICSLLAITDRCYILARIARYVALAVFFCEAASHFFASVAPCIC
jgi:hypothetical protein